MSKLNNILKELDIIQDPKENSILKNLIKIPKEEPKAVMPHTTVTGKFNTEQADLLFLPEDEGYKYLLVVVDIATRLCDAEPLKSKESKVVAKAIQRIF